MKIGQGLLITEQKLNFWKGLRIMDVKCSVVQDLLPSYIDGICSNESKSIVESHLSNCEDCTEYLNLSRKKIFNNSNGSADLNAKEPFVRVKRHYRKRIIIFSSFVSGKIKLPGFGKENSPPIHKLLLVD